jgi:transposase-like protein
VRRAEEGQLLSEPNTLALETPEQGELRRLRQELEYVSRQGDILKSLGRLVGRNATARFTVVEKLQHQYGEVEGDAEKFKGR